MAEETGWKLGAFGSTGGAVLGTQIREIGHKDDLELTRRKRRT